MAYGITRDTWEKGEGTVCLNKGRAGNACVYSVTVPDGRFVIKDFSKSPWWIRMTFGRFMIGHEYRMMKRLEGIPGVPQKLFRIDAYAFGMGFMEGETLSAHNVRGNQAEAARMAGRPQAPEPRLPVAFFEEMETIVKEMHRRGVTHLDNRNAKNVMILPGNHPGLLDFQAGVFLHSWYPHWFREVLCLADLSGVYKHWYRELLDLPDDRLELLRRHFRLRRLWVFKGYSFFKQRKPKGVELYLFQKDAAAKRSGSDRGGH